MYVQENRIGMFTQSFHTFSEKKIPSLVIGYFMWHVARSVGNQGCSLEWNRSKISIFDMEVPFRS